MLVCCGCECVVMSIDAEISCQFRMIRLNTHAKMATKSLSSVDLSAIFGAEYSNWHLILSLLCITSLAIVSDTWYLVVSQLFFVGLVEKQCQCCYGIVHWTMNERRSVLAACLNILFHFDWEKIDFHYAFVLPPQKYHRNYVHLFLAWNFWWQFLRCQTQCHLKYIKKLWMWKKQWERKKRKTADCHGAAVFWLDDSHKTEKRWKFSRGKHKTKRTQHRHQHNCRSHVWLLRRFCAVLCSVLRAVWLCAIWIFVRIVYKHFAHSNNKMWTVQGETSVAWRSCMWIHDIPSVVFRASLRFACVCLPLVYILGTLCVYTVMRRISVATGIVNEILRVDAVVAASSFRFHMTYRKHAKHTAI